MKFGALGEKLLGTGNNGMSSEELHNSLDIWERSLDLCLKKEDYAGNQFNNKCL